MILLHSWCLEIVSHFLHVVLVTCPPPHVWLQIWTEQLGACGPFQLCSLTLDYSLPFALEDNLSHSSPPASAAYFHRAKPASSFSFNCVEEMQSIWLGSVSSERQKHVHKQCSAFSFLHKAGQDPFLLSQSSSEVIWGRAAVSNWSERVLSSVLSPGTDLHQESEKWSFCAAHISTPCVITTLD